MNEVKTKRAATGTDPLRDLVDEVDYTAAKLKSLASVLQLLMEGFGLDSLELTEEQKYDLVNRHTMITDTLNLVFFMLHAEAENLEAQTTAACEAGRTTTGRGKPLSVPAIR